MSSARGPLLRGPRAGGLYPNWLPRERLPFEAPQRLVAELPSRPSLSNGPHARSPSWGE